MRKPCDALAGLRQRLVDDVRDFPGSRLLPGRFMAVQQAIGIPRANADLLPLLERFVAEAKAQGFIAERIAAHGVTGLSVAAWKTTRTPAQQDGDA